MVLRELYDSKEDFDELLNMFIDLELKQNVSFGVYLQKLLEMLQVKDAKCFIAEKDGDVCGFAIIYPDLKGGCIGQSLYIKPKYRKTTMFYKMFSALKEYVNSKYAYCDLVATNDNISYIYEKMGIGKVYTIYRYKDK